MEVTIFQAVIIGILAYLGSLSVPWFLGLTGGWYTLTRPIVSGLLIGLVFGDVQTGIMVGVAVQVVFIALVTPGGQMPQDLNSAAYIGVALGVIAVKGGATVESAVAIATAVGAIGTIFHNFMMITNSFWNHRAAACIEKGDYRGLSFNHYIGPQVTQFLFRFVPTFLVVFLGAGIANNIINYFPVSSFTMRALTALGGMLPAVGVAILLRQVTKKDLDIIYFLVGFTFVAAMGINMISLAIVGAFFAILHFKYTASKPAAKTAASDVEEEL
jgi:PTS system mannose-specific IIC component